MFYTLGNSRMFWCSRAVACTGHAGEIQQIYTEGASDPFLVLPTKHSLPVGLEELAAKCLGQEVSIHQGRLNSLNAQIIRVLSDELPEVVVLAMVVSGPGGESLSGGQLSSTGVVLEDTGADGASEWWWDLEGFSQVLESPHDGNESSEADREGVVLCFSGCQGDGRNELALPHQGAACNGDDMSHAQLS